MGQGFCETTCGVEGDVGKDTPESDDDDGDGQRRNDGLDETGCTACESEVFGASSHENDCWVDEIG